MKFISSFLMSMMFTATSMGSSLPLPHPRDLEGDWVLFDATRLCGIHLGTDEVPQANGFRLSIDPQIVPCNFSMQAVAWRPAPDGIALLDHDGSTLIFFSQEAGGYRSDIASDQGIRLRRKNATD